MGNSHHCVSVCLSVTRRYCIKTAKHRITQTTPRDSPGSLVFDANSRWWTTPLPPEICAQSDPPPFKHQKFRPIFAHSASTVRASEKNSIIANRKSTTRFSTSHRWTMYVAPKSPKGWHKTRFCYFFPVNFNFCRKTSATKFLCVKTSSGKVVATSFLYLTVHRWISGDVPSTWNLSSKWPTPVEKRRFRKISLNSAAAVRASEKSSISTNRTSTTCLPSSHRWTLCVTPKSPKGWLKTRIFTFGVALHFFVAGNRRHFKLNMWVKHSKSQPVDDKLSLKGAWSLSRDRLIFEK